MATLAPDEERATSLAPEEPRATLGRHHWRIALRYLLLVVAALIVLLPIYMTVVDALLSPQKIVTRPPTLFPLHPQWGNFSQAFSTGHLGSYLRNSAIVSVCITIASVGTSLLAGYAFTFVNFPFRRLLFGVCLATLMVPAEVTIIPNYRTIVSFGWYNTFPALIVPFAASGIGLFLFRQTFRGLPRELRDAATLDGYGHWRFLTRIVVPLNRPAIGAFAVFSFLAAWNQYLWPLLVTQSDSVRTVQIGLRQLASSDFSKADVVFAGTVLASIPIFIVLLLFQRSLVRGLTQGAVKG
jgi:sn-glycerol 3-phosphate transport system permease protein